MDVECKQHCDEKLRFYCTDCNIRVCDTCIDHAHSHHNFCTVVKAAELKRQQLHQTLGPGKEKKLQELHEISDRLQTLKQSCADRTEELTNIINKRAKMLTKRTEKTRQHLIKELLLYQEKCEQPFTEAQIQIDQCISNILNYSASMDDVMKESDTEILKIQTNLEKEMNNIPKPDSLPSIHLLKFKISEEFEVEEMFGRFVEEHEVEKLPKESDAGGETSSLPVVENDVETENASGIFNDENVPDISRTEDDEISSDGNTNKESNGFVQEDNAKYDSQTESETEISNPFLDSPEDSNELVPKDDIEQLMHDEIQDGDEFIPPTTFAIEGKASVNKVLPYSSSSIFILSNYNIKFVNMKKVKSDQDFIDGETVLQNVEDVTMTQAGHLLYIEQNESHIKRLVPPDKILNFASFPGMQLEALDSTVQDQVLVCARQSVESNNLSIAVLDMTGIRLRNLPLHMGNRLPFRIMENGNKDICIVDLAGKGISKGCIRILDSNCRHKASYAGVIGYKPSDLFQPRGICYDAENRIVVTDSRNHAVHQLNSSGKYRKILLKEDDGLTHPLSVALSKQGFLCVGCLYGKIVIRKYADILKLISRKPLNQIHSFTACYIELVAVQLSTGVHHVMATECSCRHDTMDNLQVVEHIPVQLHGIVREISSQREMQLFHVHNQFHNHYWSSPSDDHD